MGQTNERASKPPSTLNSTALNLQTRPFATPNIEEIEAFSNKPDEAIAKNPKNSENILERLINNPIPDSAEPVQPVQRKPENRLKAISPKKIAIQTKLNIGEPNDKYEKEADNTAAKVVQQINSSTNAPIQNQPIQRLEVVEEEQVEDEQKETQELLMNPETPPIQRQLVGGNRLKMKSLVQRSENIVRREALTDLESLIQNVAQQNDISVQRMITQVDSNQSVIQRDWVEKNGVNMWNKLIDGVTWFARGSEVMWFQITDASKIEQGTLEDYQLYEGQKKSLEQWEALRVAPIDERSESWKEIDAEATNKSLSYAKEDSLNPALKKVVEPKSIQELAEHAEYNYPGWCLNDNVLLNILLEIFEANWFKAKACLTMELWPSSVPEDKRPDHSVGITLMDALVNMRTRKWKEFTDRIKPEFTERMKMYEDQELKADVELQEKGKQNLQNIFDSVGAQAVTSDVDLASGGSNSELGVQFVNSKFRLEFVKGKVIPYDPGTVFDINLYASDWIHGEAGSSDSVSGVRTITPKPEVQGMSAEAEKQRTKKMEVWSLVKVRRNMSEEEWASYEEMTLSSLSDKGTRDEMNQKLIEAEFEYQTFRLRVETKQQEMEKKLKSQEEAFFNGRESAFGHDNEEYQEDAHFTRAANAIYEETLAEVKILRLQINKLKSEERGAELNHEEISNLGVQLGNKIAEALTYANEVYATEGAVQHTVLKQGAGKKLANLKKKTENSHLTGVDYDLKPELYLQSVNENVGDSLHSINHFKNVPHYAVYRAGKYLSRLCDAAEQLLTETGAKQAPFYEDLDLIGKNAVRVKAIKSGRIEGDPEYVKQDSFFKDYNDSNLATVRQEIIMFGAKIPQLFNEKKQADEERERNIENVQQQQEESPPVEER